ncbi:MAG: hypothetical protein FJZ75_00320 [Bacteroidetes bacterium]|jgi:hypothetical protein|nr:hypothetical protein [Bacteroidota bacterium]
MMQRWLDKDHFLFGLGLAIVVPTLMFSLLMGVQILSMNVWKFKLPLPTDIVLFLSIAANLLPFRYYMINRQHEQTGKGILFFTFLVALVYVYIVLGQEESWF